MQTYFADPTSLQVRTSCFSRGNMVKAYPQIAQVACCQFIGLAMLVQSSVRLSRMIRHSLTTRSSISRAGKSMAKLTSEGTDSPKRRKPSWYATGFAIVALIVVSAPASSPVHREPLRHLS